MCVCVCVCIYITFYTIYKTRIQCESLLPFHPFCFLLPLARVAPSKGHPPLSPRSPLVSLLSAIYFTKFSLSYGVTLVLEMFLRNIHGPTILLPATIFLFISPSRIETMLRDIRVTWLSSSLSYRCCLFRRVESFIYSFLSRLSFLFSFRSSLCCCGTKVGPFDNAISNLSRQNKF